MLQCGQGAGGQRRLGLHSRGGVVPGKGRSIFFSPCSVNYHALVGPSAKYVRKYYLFGSLNIDVGT